MVVACQQGGGSEIVTGNQPTDRSQTRFVLVVHVGLHFLVGVLKAACTTTSDGSLQGHESAEAESNVNKGVVRWKNKKGGGARDAMTKASPLRILA